MSEDKKDDNSKDVPAWQEAHNQACRRGEQFYIDPATGQRVFTVLKHIERGFCCHSGCRHCPYK